MDNLNHLIQSDIYECLFSTTDAVIFQSCVYLPSSEDNFARCDMEVRMITAFVSAYVSLSLSSNTKT